MKTTILVLTLNEIDCVPTILPQIRPEWADQILIVDGGSTDGTVEWCRAHGYTVYEQRVPGIRHAYIEAIPRCIGDIVLTMSPDGNCPVWAIPFLLFDAQYNDLVIGSRYKYCRSDDDDWLTGFGNWCFRWLTRLFHGGSLLDPMVIYRVFRKELFYKLELDREESYSLYERLFGTVMSIEPLMTVRALKAGMRIHEIGVGEPARIGGKRKLQIWRWGAAYLCQIIRERWNWVPRET